MATTTAYISHDDCLLHEMSPYHPESPQRLAAIKQHLNETHLIQELQSIQARPAALEQLARVHPAEHIERVRAASPSEGLAQLDADTALCPDSLNAAELAAGALVQAVDGVLNGEFERAFCAVRPPGHHAESDMSMGFCLFNNVAVGVKHALQHRAVRDSGVRDSAVERVAILDFDVHHGNGSVEVFSEDPEVLVCSSFQHPFYPGRQHQVDRPNIVNTPLAAGTRGDAFRRALERDWLPALKQHQPQLIFVSAGFDAHREDPLGQLGLVEADFAWVTELIVGAAQESAQGRVISALEGGYDLTALSRSVYQHLIKLAEL